MEETGGTNTTITREQFLAVLHSNDSVFCCLPCCKQTNKILPTRNNETNSEFFEFTPSRKIRIINRYPRQDYLDNWRTESQADTKTLEETLSEDEDYWFENAAPTRLPVIQPPPLQQQNRIINKFEPRTQPSISSKSLEEDVISPGRMPRKNFKKECVEDTDDYEDESQVSTSLSNENETPENQKKKDTVMSSVMKSSAGTILDITAESTVKIKRSSSLNKTSESPKSRKSLSPVSRKSISPVSRRSSSPSLRRSLSPGTRKSGSPGTRRSKSPNEGSDEGSREPSPEVPDRVVCAVPDPIESNSDRDTFSNIVVTGSNLGGVANQGFTSDEEDEPDKDVQVDAVHQHVRISNQNATKHETSSATTFPTPEPLRFSEHNNLLPILFFLHGVGGSADIWNSQMQYFVSRGYQVIAPDMLGHGFSSCPDKLRAYTFTKLFKDIISIFDTYVPDNRSCVVIGHSYGCSFGAALARTRPEKVISLILIASGGPTPLAPPPNLSRYPKWIMNFLRLALECKFRSQQHKYNPRGKSIKFKEAFDVPSYVFKYVMLGQIWPEGDAGFHRRIGVPTLLVYGMRDTLVSLVEECEMERTIPKVGCVLMFLPGQTFF